MDFNAIYKLNEDEQQNANPAPAQGEDDGLPQDVHASEEALNIAMNQLQLIVKSFKEDNYIQQMMDFYDGKSAKKESVEADNNAEHLTEAKKGSFKYYFNLIVKSLSNAMKKIKIVVSIVFVLAIVAGIGYAGNLIGKAIRNQRAIKDAAKLKPEQLINNNTLQSLPGNLGANVAGVPGATGTENPAETPAEAPATATEELVDKPVEAGQPDTRLGGLTTEAWVNQQKANGLGVQQIETAYEQEGFSRNGPKFIAAMTAAFGGYKLASVTKSPVTTEFTGDTADGKSVKGDTNTYQVSEITPEEKQAEVAKVEQEIAQNPEKAQEVAQEVQNEEGGNTADATADATANANGDASAENPEAANDQAAQEKEAINEANAQSAWQKGQQAGAQIRNIKGGMGSGYAMWLEDSQKLVWSDKKSGGTQFEFLNTTDGGQSFICGSKHYVFDGKQYQVDKNAAVLNEQGQPLTLVQFIVRESQKNTKYDAQVDQYVNEHGQGSNHCGQYSWGGVVPLPTDNPRNPGETKDTWVLSSKLYLNGKKTNFVIMPISNGQIVAADPDKQQIIFLQNRPKTQVTEEGIPLGTPLTMPQVVQKLIEKSQLNGAAVAVGLTAPTGYGALVGTAICPGLGTFIGGMIGLFAGALATGIAADFKKKGIFGVIAWNTLDEQSKQLLVAHAAKNFTFSTKDAEGLDEQELTTKVNAGKQIFQQNGISIINAGHPQPTDSINCVLRNAGNAIASALLGCKNNGNPYQTAAEQYIQPQA